MTPNIAFEPPGWPQLRRAAGACEELTDTQREELDRRLAEHEANPHDVVPWEDVKSSLDKRLKK